jgi:L-lactate utilization protein LutB
MSKMTGLFKSSEEKVKEALNPITRTVDSIEQTFKEKEEGLDNNYLIIKDKLPKYGEKIYKLEAMANALSIINEKVTHPETKTIITQRVSNYSKIAIDYRE